MVHISDEWKQTSETLDAPSQELITPNDYDYSEHMVPETMFSQSSN